MSTDREQTRRVTKREASQRLAIIAAEIRLVLDASDEDCPTWADDLDGLADELYADSWNHG